MIIGYVGTPGSGKSYEAVKEILGRIRTGRKIYTNIEGLDRPECKEAIKTYCNITTEQLEICLNHITDEEAKEFWLHVESGSIIVIDEVHKLFSNREWSSEKNKQFTEWMSTHRHEGCDVIIITQDIEKVDKHARSLIEWTYYFRKMNQFGKKLETKYICYSYQGDNHNGQPLKKNIRTYDQKVFRCYKSYVADDIKELGIGTRVNLFKHPVFYALPVILLFLGYLFTKSSYIKGELIHVPDAEATTITDVKKTQSVKKVDITGKEIPEKKEVIPEQAQEPEEEKAIISKWLDPKTGRIIYTNNGIQPPGTKFVTNL